MIEYLLEVLKDVQLELSDPEIAELITPALDKKIERAINMIENDEVV